MAGLAGVVAVVWPDVVRDVGIEEFDRADRVLRGTRATRGSQQVLAHLTTHAVADCRGGTIGLWEQVSFGTKTEEYAADGTISDIEGRDLVAIYEAIKRP